MDRRCLHSLLYFHFSLNWAWYPTLVIPATLEVEVETRGLQVPGCAGQLSKITESSAGIEHLPSLSEPPTTIKKNI